ncbi:caspase domain-containing protein [Russula brevipes]|nr:caspase domain-containing protein [Russula brevipes]
MFTPFPQPHRAEPASIAPSNAPSMIRSPASMPGHVSPNPIPNDHLGSPHHSFNRSRSPSPGYMAPGPPLMEQGHHYRPHSPSHSNGHHYLQDHHHSQSHGPHDGYGSPNMPPAPMLLTSQHSEPMAPYDSTPPFTHPPGEYQPPFPAQSEYDPAFSPEAAADAPMPVPSPAPSGGQRGIPSSYYSPLSGSPSNPPAQSRGLRVSQSSRSHARMPPMTQEADARDPTRRDWRCHPLFRHSRCTGARKALCVGINYTGQQNSLQGCVDDAQNIYQFLLEHRYPHSNIIVLTDDNPSPRSQPTRKNILNAMRWLVEGAHPDDALFFHYSGHGGRTRDQDGDEIDGWDEVIFPLDYRTTGIITDDLLHDTLVKPLPAGCRLTAVFDSCHSGSILDLVFEFHSNGKLKSSPVSRAFHQAKTSPADVVCFSGCKDSQTSADVVQGGVAVGAMSYAFLKVLKRNPQISYIDLLRGVREILRKKYSQRPQLSATNPINVKQSFII